MNFDREASLEKSLSNLFIEKKFNKIGILWKNIYKFAINQQFVGKNEKYKM